MITWIDILVFASIPISGGLIGWFTNWLAIKMTFYPIEFWGVRPIGWQGIIPSKAQKMAEKSLDMLTGKLLQIEERFARIEPTRVAIEMTPSLHKLSREIVNEAMQSQFPLIWLGVPQIIKNQIYLNLTKDLPHLVEELVLDIRRDLEKLLDIRKLGVDALTQNKHLLNQIFIDCGKKEFKFIELSGIYFGIPFGLVQMVISIFYNPWWMLPLFGLLVGWATNYLALKMIFEPSVPRTYLFGLFTFQGLFIKRQPEVSEAYARVVTYKILTTESMFEFILRGPGSDKLAEIVRLNIERAVDTAVINNRTLVRIAISAKQLQVIKNIAVYRFLQELPVSFQSTLAYAEEALDMENMLRDKMQSLSSAEFVGFLRPVFQEDEWILILVGAMLGLAAGCLQYWAMFNFYY
ncbi:MAG: hypothetical protein MUE85_12330 [Microscillaceae bacterium]|jgi:uncharacterized membrane protein YheB (UPF0754 family)|nr:hypothetical protein [Microscillaceae bacterium]